MFSLILSIKLLTPERASLFQLDNDWAVLSYVQTLVFYLLEIQLTLLCKCKMRLLTRAFK